MNKSFRQILNVFLFSSLLVFASCKNNAEEVKNTPAEETVKVTYVVTYSTKYGVVPDSLTFTDKQKLTEENLPVLEEKGRTFMGWYIGSDKVEAGFEVSANITLVALWETENYTITYYANTTESQEAIKETYEYDTQISVKDNSFKAATGYNFNYWNTKSDGTGTSYNKGEVLNLTANLELYAIWIEKGSHNIIYANVNSADNSENPSLYAEKDDFTFKALADLQYYTFDGWYKDSQFAEKITGWKAGEYTTDITVYAKWIPVSYTLSFDSNSGSGTMAAVTVSYGEIISLPANAYTKAGYSFAGWNTQADGKGSVYGDSTSFSPAGNTKLYAQWNLETYRITYVLNNGTVSSENPIFYTVETETIDLVSPEKEGSDFTGWHKDIACSDTGIYKIEKGSTGNLILYAGFTSKKCKVTFNNNGSDVTGSVSEIILEYNVHGKLPDCTLTRTGYTFDYWNNKEDGTGDFSYLNGGQIVTTTDVVLYAIWKINKYEITYNLDGGTNNSENPEFYTIAKDTLELKAAEKTGYDFAGWYLVENDEVTEKKISSIKTSQMTPIEVTAKWTPSTDTEYTVVYLLQNFADDNYTLDKSETKKGTTGTKTIISKDSVKDLYSGYELLSIDEKEIAADGSTVVQIKYNLPVVWFGFEGMGYTFNGENTLWLKAKAGTVIGSIFEYDNPNRPGYAFGGWFDKTTNEKLDLSMTMTEQKRFYAVWSYAVKTVTITNIEDITMTSTVSADNTKITFTLPEGLTSYKWYLDDVLLTEETNNTLTVDASVLIKNGVYTVYAETVENGIPKSASAEFVVGE